MRPTGAKSNSIIETCKQDNLDILLSNLIKSDPVTMEPDAEILHGLEKRVEFKRKTVTGNSFAGILFPMFALKNVELKMAFVSIVIILSLGINPHSNYKVKREISPFTLADTLIDSSKIKNPVYDLIKDLN